MAQVSSKNGRDQALEFQDLLHDLQTWEHSLMDKDKKLKGRGHEENNVIPSSRKTGKGSEDRGATQSSPIVEVSKPFNAVPLKLRSNSGPQYGHLRKSDINGSISSSLLAEESMPDANSEKDQGNEYFKEKKFTKAIECYSRSIALSPTAVAFANRAMAYLKIRRFEDAENDCTEALNLDDRYVKAYSRRATARKELGKLKMSIEDSEFALRLEPNNQELKKQYSEVKGLYEKEIIRKASQAVKNSFQGIQRVEEPKMEVEGNVKDPQHVPNSSEKLGVPAVQADPVKRDSGHKNSNVNKREPQLSVQELASRAASRALAASSKNITTPKSAYQFEVSWRGFSDNRELQANLLKTIPPATLPQLFKNALSAPILVDIVKCIATFFSHTFSTCREEMELAVNFLENLARVPRFDMIIMCLSSLDKADLHKIWDEVFSSGAVPVELTEALCRLRPKYCPGGWQTRVSESNSWSKEMS